MGGVEGTKPKPAPMVRLTDLSHPLASGPLPDPFVGVESVLGSALAPHTLLPLPAWANCCSVPGFCSPSPTIDFNIARESRAPSKQKHRKTEDRENDCLLVCLIKLVSWDAKLGLLCYLYASKWGRGSVRVQWMNVSTMKSGLILVSMKPVHRVSSRFS